MNNLLLIIVGIGALITPFIMTGQEVGIGTTSPHPSAQLEISSTDKGILFPRLTTIQRDNIPNPAHGLLIFNTDNFCIEVYNATTGQWEIVSCPSTCNPCDTCAVPNIVAISGPQQVCPGDTVTYYNNSNDANSWSWDPPNDWQIITPGDSVTFVAGSSYGWIYGTACNECGCKTDSLLVQQAPTCP
ncbi:MAG: hypothetical protein GXO48_01975 [Chlorobi bacterium]|nr:hypothetical protein [Chlorobiota bacterium]